MPCAVWREAADEPARRAVGRLEYQNGVRLGVIECVLRHLTSAMHAIQDKKALYDRGEFMRSQRNIGFIALITPLWFLAIYMLMSSQRPEYRHAINAISELGTLDAPNPWVWNILGYILPGLAIALLGVGLKREFAPLHRNSIFPALALVASGLFMALSGAFPANLDDRGSTTTLLHLLGSFGCFLAFLIAGFWLPKYFHKNLQLRWIAWPSLLLVIASIATVFLRAGATPGLGQRLTFLCLFLWVTLVGFALLRANSRDAFQRQD